MLTPLIIMLGRACDQVSELMRHDSDDIGFTFGVGKVDVNNDALPLAKQGAPVAGGHGG